MSHPEAEDINFSTHVENCVTFRACFRRIRVLEMLWILMKVGSSRDHGFWETTRTQGPRDKMKTSETSGGPANRKFKFRETRARERAPSSGLSPPASRGFSAPTSFHSFGLFSRATSTTPPSPKRATRKSVDSICSVPVSHLDLNFKTRRELTGFCCELSWNFTAGKSCSDFKSVTIRSIVFGRLSQ